MNWIFIIPVISLLAGYIFGIVALNIFFNSDVYQKKKKILSLHLTRVIASDLFLSADIMQNIAEPANFKKIMPLVETHIDNFLRVKLTSEMPYITAFIGDKTIESLKKIFMQELEILFPEVMTNYINTLKSQAGFENILSEKLNNISRAKMRQFLKPLTNAFLFYSLAAGFLTGLANLVFFLIIR